MLILRLWFFLCFAVAQTVICSPIYSIRQDAPSMGPQIISSLTSISGSLDTFSSAINAYSGGLLSLLPIDNVQRNLDTAIKACTTTVTQSGPLSPHDNAAVAGQIANMLPKISASAGGLQSKAQQMMASGAGPLISLDITTIQLDFNGLSAQIQRIVNPTTNSTISRSTTLINNFLSQAAQSFGQPTIPTLPGIVGSRESE